MSNRKTVGDRIADFEYSGTTFEGSTIATRLSKAIDRAIRRAQAKAWDEGAHQQYGETNPYRGRTKR